MIFRVSRILLESINRPVNIEKHTQDFGEELTTLKEAIFSGLFFSLIYICYALSLCYFVLFYFLYVFSLFYRPLEEKRELWKFRA